MPDEGCWNCGSKDFNLAGEHGLVCTDCGSAQEEE